MNPAANPIRLILFAVILLELSPATRAAEDTFAGWAVYLDQDFFIPGKNEDRDYTMGFCVEWFWEAEPKTAGFLDNALSFINDQVGTTNRSSKFQKSLLFGSITFTPEDIGDSKPIFNDRPYASIWYLSSKRIAIKEGDDLDPKSRDTVSGSEFLFGVLGTNLSKPFKPNSTERTVRFPIQKNRSTLSAGTTKYPTEANPRSATDSLSRNPY